MKKLCISTLILSAVMTTAIYAGGYNFHDGVYRGEKYKFDFGNPKENFITVIPENTLGQKVCDNGYVGHDTSPKRLYDIILLSY